MWKGTPPTLKYFKKRKVKIGEISRTSEKEISYNIFYYGPKNPAFNITVSGSGKPKEDPVKYEITVFRDWFGKSNYKMGPFHPPASGSSQLEYYSGVKLGIGFCIEPIGRLHHEDILATIYDVPK